MSKIPAIAVLTLFGLTAANTAQAARYTGLRIKLNDQFILNHGASDRGELSHDQVWAKLRLMRFRKKNCKNDFVIRPETNNPKRMTITGRIEFRMNSGGKANLKKLVLTRSPDKKDEWLFSAAELKRITAIRDGRLIEEESKPSAEPKPASPKPSS